MRLTKLVWALALLPSFACGDNRVPAADADLVDAAQADADISPDATVYPNSLRETGLYSDFDNRVIAGDVSSYEVSYPLWSDGAIKRRFVHLPEGATIDTSDMDFWVYPEGTKLWKEFKVDSKLIETRLLWKTGATSADWYYVSYAWNIEQTEAIAVPDGAIDVLGTSFDIPEQRDCRKCHQRQPDYSLGFSALQLAHTQAGVNLDSLVADSRLTTNPIGESPYFPVPGVGAEEQVLGYLHGNCGGCHHKSSDVMDTTKLNMRLEVASIATVAETTTYSTIVGVPALLSIAGATTLIEEGKPDESAIYLRMSVRDSAEQMPPRGSELVDTEMLLVLRGWIEGL